MVLILSLNMKPNPIRERIIRTFLFFLKKDTGRLDLLRVRVLTYLTMVLARFPQELILRLKLRRFLAILKDLKG